MLNLALYRYGIRCKVVFVANVCCGMVNPSLGNLSSHVGANFENVPVGSCRGIVLQLIARS